MLIISDFPIFEKIVQELGNAFLEHLGPPNTKIFPSAHTMGAPHGDSDVSEFVEMCSVVQKF